MDPGRLLLIQLLITGALFGLIWTVQLAVYAHFPRILAVAGEEGFKRYHADYTRSMGYVAGPLMLLELAATIGWVLHLPEGDLGVSGVASLVLLGGVWAHTFAWMVPIHVRLQRAPSELLARHAVRVNWVRTALWSARLALLLAC